MRWNRMVDGSTGSPDGLSQRWIPSIMWLKRSVVRVFLGTRMSMGVGRRSPDGTTDEWTGKAMIGVGRDMITVPSVERATVAATE